jgi:hypothetical protein
VFSTPERHWETKPLMKMGDFDICNKKNQWISPLKEICNNLNIKINQYQSAEPEYDVCWRVSEANESQTSYSVEQADIFQNQSYSHSDDMFIILNSFSEFIVCRGVLLISHKVLNNAC